MHVKKQVLLKGSANEEGSGRCGELFPQSVFIVASYDEDGVPNAMNVAWAGECTRHEVAINIGDHKTTENIIGQGRVHRGSG